MLKEEGHIRNIHHMIQNDGKKPYKNARVGHDFKKSLKLPNRFL